MFLLYFILNLTNPKSTFISIWFCFDQLFCFGLCFLIIWLNGLFLLYWVEEGDNPLVDRIIIACVLLIIML